MAALADAESHRQWLDAEQIVLELLADDPENLHLRERLQLIQQSHAPLVFSRNGSVYVSGPDLLDEALVTDEVSAVWPVWSPDRTRIAFYASTDSSTGRYGLYVVNLDGTDLRLLADRVRLEGWPIWSPDGTRIAFTSLEDFMFEGNHGISSIRVADIATGTVIDLTSDQFHYVTSPSWSPDSSHIAFISKRVYSRGAAVGRRVEGSLHVIDVGTRATTQLAPKQLPHVDYVTWSPVDDLLLLLSTEIGSGWYDMQFTTIQLVDVRTGVVDDLTNRSQAVSYPFWSPDGSRFAFTEGNNIVQVRGIDGAVTMINVPRDAAPFLSWSPDGNLLVVPANNPGMASMIVPVVGGGAAADLSLTYDYSAELAGPPQWAPRTTQEAAPTGLISGTALDR
jgi:TolB protein